MQAIKSKQSTNQRHNLYEEEKQGPCGDRGVQSSAELEERVDVCLVFQEPVCFITKYTAGLANINVSCLQCPGPVVLLACFGLCYQLAGRSLLHCQ